MPLGPEHPHQVAGCPHPSASRATSSPGTPGDLPQLPRTCEDIINASSPADLRVSIRPGADSLPGWPNTRSVPFVSAKARPSEHVWVRKAASCSQNFSKWIGIHIAPPPGLYLPLGTGNEMRFADRLGPGMPYEGIIHAPSSDRDCRPLFQPFLETLLFRTFSYKDGEELRARQFPLPTFGAKHKSESRLPAARS